MAKTTKNTNLAVADVCLYGTRQTGAGFIIALADGRMFGDGTPDAGRSFTDAIWTAVDIIRAAGIQAGRVQVFHPGGEFVSDVDLAGHVPTYGSLASRPAQVFILPSDAILGGGGASAAL